MFARQIYQANIRENNSIGIPILQVVATDDDAGTNAAIAYSLVPGTGSDDDDDDRSIEELVRIDSSTGIIYAIGIFDYELKARYKFRVVASNPGQGQDQSIPEVQGHDVKLSTSVTVELEVIDANDEPPMFSSESFQFWNVRKPASRDRDRAPARDRPGWRSVRQVHPLHRLLSTGCAAHVPRRFGDGQADFHARAGSRTISGPPSLDRRQERGTSESEFDR